METTDFLGHEALSTISLGDGAVRLAVALVFGAVLGFDRERIGKPAGLRTHILVTLGAAFFVMLGTEILGGMAPAYERARVDPTRVLEGVVGGIGFLGAGSILRHNDSVEGVTTAATIWFAGAVGAGCGLGRFALTAIALGFAMFAVVVLRWTNKWIER